MAHSIDSRKFRVSWSDHFTATIYNKSSCRSVSVDSSELPTANEFAPMKESEFNRICGEFF